MEDITEQTAEIFDMLQELECMTFYRKNHTESAVDIELHAKAKGLLQFFAFNCRPNERRTTE